MSLCSYPIAKFRGAVQALVYEQLHCSLPISGKEFNYSFSDKFLKFPTGSATNLYAFSN